MLLLLALCILPELIFQLADRGLLDPPNLRALAYSLGAFQPGLFLGHGPVFTGQSLTMFLTYSVLHTGLIHLAINMIGLVWLGRLTLEYRVPETFLTFYLISSVGAAEVFALIGPKGGTMVGASGALFGLLGVLLVDSGVLQGTASSNRVAPQIVHILFATLVLALADVGSSIVMASPVAWHAHAGGFLTGAFIALIYPRFFRISAS